MDSEWLNRKGLLHLCRCHINASRWVRRKCVCARVRMFAILLTASVWAPNRKEPAGRSVLTQAPVNLLFLLFFIPASLSLCVGMKKSESGWSSTDIAEGRREPYVKNI